MSHDASVEQQILATIDKWVEQELRPIAREFDQADEYPSDLVEQMKEFGLFGPTIRGNMAAGSASTYPDRSRFGKLEGALGHLQFHRMANWSNAPAPGPRKGISPQLPGKLRGVWLPSPTVGPKVSLVPKDGILLLNGPKNPDL
ncbi:MAG: hypothetical protein CM15mP92_2170 [Halieaceae bacterium]|nr:MAG: hypothetical protein CM15mP92_2170 [Halieaceae bacterium]